jgi:6-hydroxy-3-succinoylpyridine 3-monooxygenase
LRTTVYIDGFSLYYGCLKKTPYKWLDLYSLFKDRLLDSSTTELRIKYFTAKILPSSSDDPQAPFRQQKYIEALIRYRPEVEVIYGYFQRPKKFMRRVDPDMSFPEDSKDRHTVKVLVFEEKQSDVNIAVHMLEDAWSNKLDQAVLCSNDTDLVGVFSCLKRNHGDKRLGVVAPVRTNPSEGGNRRAAGSLAGIADWSNPWISPEHLKNSQLPETIPGTNIRKPDKWK